MSIFEFPIYFCFYILILAFFIGACFASGLTCLSWRITHGEKWGAGKSHCESCGHELSLRDLIPIVSWVSLKGKCRYCGTKINGTTACGEAFLGIISVLLVIKFGISIELIKAVIFVYILFCIALCDLYSFEIPDRFAVIGVVVWIIFMLFADDKKSYFIHGVVGAIIIAGAVLLISQIMSRILGKDAMGGGDIKLLALTGLYLGLGVNFITLLFSCVLGLVLNKIITKPALEDDEVPEGAFPFGPAIALAALICVFVGEPLLNMYLSLF